VCSRIVAGFTDKDRDTIIILFNSLETILVSQVITEIYWQERFLIAFAVFLYEELDGFSLVQATAGLTSSTFLPRDILILPSA